ncbi:MAG: 50S ribosomal protein L6 [Deltaproteobacteria bacterium]|nr:50S ribosomal protein L6 [Deltaproteobacteria bacterium]MBW2660983.1 50S ribosomal protein L6 [Deltaproteobacteria bacterium]
MSRVGKKPIPISDKIKILYKDKVIAVHGEKGTLVRSIHPSVDLKMADGFISIIIINNDDRKGDSLQGLTRSLVANMVTGVTSGFERVLQINGIGYRAALKGNTIVFNLGYSHPVNFDLPDGISAIIEKNNIIKLSGIDKEKLGMVSASIRRLRPPEPYKGKGIKYAEERIQRKAGKTGTK